MTPKTQQKNTESAHKHSRIQVACSLTDAVKKCKQLTVCGISGYRRGVVSAFAEQHPRRAKTSVNFSIPFSLFSIKKNLRLFCELQGKVISFFFHITSYWKTVNIFVHFVHRQCGVWTRIHQLVNTVLSSRKRRAHCMYLDSKL